MKVWMTSQQMFLNFSAVHFPFEPLFTSASKKLSSQINTSLIHHFRKSALPKATSGFTQNRPKPRLPKVITFTQLHCTFYTTLLTLDLFHSTFRTAHITPSYTTLTSLHLLDYTYYSLLATLTTLRLPHYLITRTAFIASTTLLHLLHFYTYCTCCTYYTCCTPRTCCTYSTFCTYCTSCIFSALHYTTLHYATKHYSGCSSHYG